MSYPYGQYPGENYSTPTTPLDAYPQWETVEREEQQQQQSQQQQSELHSPTVPPPTPTQQPYQIIHLEEPPRVVPTQHPPAHDNTPVRLHHVHRLEGRPDSQRDSEFRLHIDTARAISTTAGPVRQTRSQQHQQQVHPYRRPASASSSVPAARQRDQHVRFASGQPSSSTMPSPSSVPGRVASFGSAISSPVTAPDTTVLPASSKPDSSGGRRRFIIRTDSNYDPESKVLTAMLELPGVKKADLRVTLSTCHYNRVRQITVSGYSSPVFPLSSVSSEVGPGGELTVRERKFGEFTRTFPVPSDIKREDIDAVMEDGILTLKISCGMPAQADSEDIPVR